LRRKMETASQVLEKAAEVFDLPGEALGGVPRVTVTGMSRVHIENHRGLIGYGTEEISVSGGRMIVRVRGRNLELVAMSDMELVASGTVTGVEFLE